MLFIDKITAQNIKPFINKRCIIEFKDKRKQSHTIIEYLRGNIITDSDAIYKTQIKSITYNEI